MTKLHENGAWGTAPDDNDDAMDLYQTHVIEPLQQGLMALFETDFSEAIQSEENMVWGRVGALAELKEEAPGLWRQMFDPIIDDEQAQAVLYFAYEDLLWLRRQHAWFDRWDNPGAVKRAISRWEKILLEWMSRRTLGAGAHRR